jgi:hypothetical protein
MKKLVLTLCIGLLTIFSASIVQANMTIPNTFTSGTPAHADSVNDNFTAIEIAMPGIEFIDTPIHTAVGFPSAVASSIQVTAPTDGFLFVHAWGNGNCSTMSENFMLQLENETTGVITGTAVNHRNTNHYQHFSISHVFVVGPGTDKINLLARCDTSGLIGVNTLTAIFLPNRY